MCLNLSWATPNQINVPSDWVTAGEWGVAKCLSALPTCACGPARLFQLSSQKFPGGFNAGFSYGPFRMSYLFSSSESHQLFLSLVFTATQDVILTECRFLKCDRTSPFSKSLASSEKPQLEHISDWENMEVTELWVWIATPTLPTSMLLDKTVLFPKSQFSNLLNRGTISTLEIGYKD